MAANGLFVHISQVNFEMVEYTGTDKAGKPVPKSVAQFDFEIKLAHVSGETAPAENMTVALPFTGAQTSGAARSYAVKEWMKSRFLASSGDQDDEADLMQQDKGGMRLSKSAARELDERLREELRQLEVGADHEAVARWWQENGYRIETLPQDWYLTLRIEYATVWKKLKAEADLDSMSNDQLDALANGQELKQEEPA